MGESWDLQARTSTEIVYWQISLLPWTDDVKLLADKDLL